MYSSGVFLTSAASQFTAGAIPGHRYQHCSSSEQHYLVGASLPAKASGHSTSMEADPPPSRASFAPTVGSRYVCRTRPAVRSLPTRLEKYCLDISLEPGVGALVAKCARAHACPASERPAEAAHIAVADFFGCLLYTSPSPRDRQKSRMPSSA